MARARLVRCHCTSCNCDRRISRRRSDRLCAYCYNGIHREPANRPQAQEAPAMEQAPRTAASMAAEYRLATRAIDTPSDRADAEPLDAEHMRYDPALNPAQEQPEPRKAAWVQRMDQGLLPAKEYRP